MTFLTLSTLTGSKGVTLKCPHKEPRFLPLYKHVSPDQKGLPSDPHPTLLTLQTLSSLSSFVNVFQLFTY